MARVDPGLFNAAGWAVLSPLCRRQRLTANEPRAARDAAFRTWREVAGIASAA